MRPPEQDAGSKALKVAGWIVTIVILAGVTVLFWAYLGILLVIIVPLVECNTPTLIGSSSPRLQPGAKKKTPRSSKAIERRIIRAGSRMRLPTPVGVRRRDESRGLSLSAWWFSWCALSPAAARISVCIRQTPGHA